MSNDKKVKKMEYARALKEAKPFDPSWPRYGCALINRNCILPCKMCLNWKNQAESPENKFKHFKKYIEALAEFVEYPMEINIMGGEPLLEDWIFDLVEVVEEKGFTSIISTNAYLIDDRKAKRIMNSSLRVVGISLDSIDSKVHNFYRGKPDVTERVFEAIRLLEKHKLPNKAPTVDVLTLFMKKNLDGIIDLVKWVDKNSFVNNVAFSALLNSILPSGTANWFRENEYKDIWPDDYKKICEVMDELIRMKKNGSNIVNPILQLQAFKEYYKNPIEFVYSTPYSLKDFVIEMEPAGELYLSGQRLGNINDTKTLKEQWYSKEANEIREKVSKLGSESARSALINFICVFQECNANELDCSVDVKDFVHDQTRKGFFFQKQGKYKEAVEHFKKASESDPSDANLHLGIAHNSMRLGDYKTAVEEYDRAFQLDPKTKDEFTRSYGISMNAGALAMKDFVRDQTQKGVFCQEQGKYKEAVEHFKKASEGDPSDANLHLGIAHNSMRLGDYKTAVEEYDRAFQLDPKIKDEFTRGYETSMNTKVLAMKDFVRDQTQKGVFCQEQGKYKEAVEHFKKASEGDPSDANLHLGIAHNSMRLGDYKTAVEEYDRAFQLDPRLKKESIYDYNNAISGRSKIVARGKLILERSERQEKDVRKPTFCSIEVLYSCILKCKMCHMWKNPRSAEEMSIPDWKKFIVELKEFTGTSTSINITGGEPLLKEGVLDLVRFTVGSGFNVVSMTTNGFLIDKSIASAIADSGLSMISMSLESLDEKVHDNIRGVKGACRKVMEAFKYFKDYPGGLKKLGIQTIIMGPNLEGISDLVQWAHTRKISIYFMAIAQPLCLSLSSNWHLESEYSFLWPNKKARLFEMVDRLIKFKEEGIDIGNSVAQLKAFKVYFTDPNDFVKKYRQCRMGDGMLKLDPQGNVSLCAEKGSIGNVRTDRIEDLWFSEKAASVRESIKTCKTNCPQLINCFFED